MIFGNFLLGGRAGKFLVYMGADPLGKAPKSRGGAEDFDDFGKNVLEKFSKIQ